MIDRSILADILWYNNSMQNCINAVSYNLFEVTFMKERVIVSGLAYRKFIHNVLALLVFS